jgi:hypothetical protein
MRRGTTGLIVILTLGILLAPLSSGAQPRTKVPRIGFIKATSPSTGRHFLDAL